MARGVMDAASGAHSRTSVTFDIGRWSADDVKQLMAAFAAESGAYKLRLKGVNTDTSGARKLGVELDRANSGLYEGVPIVIADVDFDSFEVVLEPTR